MKQEFEMTDADLAEMKEIASHPSPVMMVGGVDFSNNTQDMANSFWKKLGGRLGFVWDTVEGSSRGIKFFLATPCESEMNKIIRIRKELQEKISKANTALSFAQEELRIFEEAHNF